MHLEGGPSGSRSFNEIEFLDITGWEGTVVLPDKFYVERVESAMRVFLTPPPNRDWNYQMFNFDTDPQRMARVAALA